VIGGKVVDPSALAAYLQGSLAIDAWLATAAAEGIVLYLPALALAEVRAVYPDAEGWLSDLLSLPWVVHAELSPQDALTVAQMLIESRRWDASAGHVILVARQRGWPVLTTDPGRLQRIALDLDMNEL
jgi:hypothetical protein